eukprot:1191932-Prorocentrum_minimum.AAC.8
MGVTAADKRGPGSGAQDPRGDLQCRQGLPHHAAGNAGPCDRLTLTLILSPPFTDVTSQGCDRGVTIRAMYAPCRRRRVGRGCCQASLCVTLMSHPHWVIRAFTPEPHAVTLVSNPQRSPHPQSPYALAHPGAGTAVATAGTTAGTAASPPPPGGVGKGKVAAAGARGAEGKKLSKLKERLGVRRPYMIDDFRAKVQRVGLDTDIKPLIRPFRPPPSCLTTGRSRFRRTTTQTRWVNEMGKRDG